MPTGVLDGIRAYLDYIDTVDSVDYRYAFWLVIFLISFIILCQFRRSIFIFLSNTGGKEITKKVHDIWLTGKVKREELTVSDFERLVELGAFNEEGKTNSNLYLLRIVLMNPGILSIQVDCKTVTWLKRVWLMSTFLSYPWRNRTFASARKTSLKNKIMFLKIKKQLYSEYSLQFNVILDQHWLHMF